MSSRIEDLEPVTRGLCERFLADAASQGINLRVTHTLRTMDEQLHLYAKGRELRDGVWKIVDIHQIVTKARPGQSPHNYGLAFDICFAGADPYPHEDDPRWTVLGKLGESLGLDWGGPLGAGDKFTFDRPHFQRANWRQFIPKEGVA